MIHGHGDDTYQFDNIQYNFSSNVNPLGINTGLKEHLKNCIDLLNAYPDPEAQNLAKSIERNKELPSGSVLITNGAVEAFYILASLNRNKKSLIYTPSFAEYEDACVLNNHSVELCNNALFPSEKEKEADMVWICNPNNPDGKVFDIEILKNQIKQYPETLFVLDEAYVEFTDKNISLEKKAPEIPNLVVVRSLTKRFSIPGLRLGYWVTSPAFLSKIKSVLMPWRINTLALEAGKHCFSSRYSDNFNLSALLSESQHIQKRIAQIDGFEPLPSSTSFFLVKSKAKAAVLKEYLVKNHHILIRDASNFRGLSDYYFRISTQIPAINNYLIEALKTWSC